MTDLAPKLNNYRYLMVVNNLWFLLQEMGLGWSSPYNLRLTKLPCTRGKNTYTILRFKQGLNHCHSTIGKSLRFTIPYSKANNKSKSVWRSIHPAPKSLPCIWFSESRILTLGHPHKHGRISLVNVPSLDISIDFASQTNIYRSFTTLRFCVTPIRSSVDKGISSSRVFPSARVCLLLGRSWGLWVMAHLITCNPWAHPRGNWLFSKHTASWHS